VIETLPKRVARILGVALRPKERHQRLARNASLHGKVDQQSRPRVLGEQPVQLAVVADDVQATEGDELDGHVLWCGASLAVASMTRSNAR